MAQFQLVQIKSICRRQIKCNLKLEISFGKGGKHCGNRRKCWLLAFSPFPTMFFKSFPSQGCQKSGLRGKVSMIAMNLLTVHKWMIGSD